jgi:hypothetical protein
MPPVDGAPLSLIGKTQRSPLTVALPSPSRREEEAAQAEREMREMLEALARRTGEGGGRTKH